MGINVAQFVRQWAIRDGSRPALSLLEKDSETPRTFSYGELDQRAMQSAAFLAHAGFKPGARIAVCLPNGIGFLDAFLGGLYAGCTLIPVPPMSAAPELAQRLVHGRCSGLITDSQTRTLGQAALAFVRSNAPGLPEADPTFGSQTRAPAFTRFDIDASELLTHEADEHAGPCDLPAGALAMLLYTTPVIYLFMERLKGKKR